MICAIFECQHFVDNSQLQHFRFHFRSHSDFSTARTVKINIFVEINTMSLTNIAVIKEPTIRMPAKLSLTTIGLTTRAIKLSSVVNATCLAPQAFHDETYNNDMETWWLCTTTELHEAMKDVATEQIKGINGSTLMPSFDKVILSRSPTQAVTTAFYHYTEGHFTTNSGQMILSSFTVNKGQQLVRLGNKSINLFNRAYLMPQLQVEAGSTIKFTTDELASTQHWVLESNNGQGIMSRIATTLSWGNGYLWTYNYVFPTSLVVDDNSDHWKALLQAVEYAGATCINKLPQQECQRIWTLLTDASNYQPLRQLQLAGTKTPERLRGNSQVIEWVNNTFTWEEYALGFNEYHNKMSDDEDNMMQQGE